VRGERSFIEWENANFSNLLRERRKGWVAGKPVLHKTPLFFLKVMYLYRFYLLPTSRYVRVNLLNGKLWISLILVKGRRKGWSVDQSILHKIPQLFLGFKKVYLAYYSPTNREVRVHLLNGKLWISSISVLGMGNEWHPGQPFLSQIHWFFLMCGLE
jgi:hypothetical protein